MLVQVSDPAAIQELSDFFAARLDAIIERRAGNGLEICLIGSYSIAAMEKEIDLVLREWESVPRREPCLVGIGA